MNHKLTIYFVFISIKDLCRLQVILSLETSALFLSNKWLNAYTYTPSLCVHFYQAKLYQNQIVQLLWKTGRSVVDPAANSERKKHKIAM